MNSRHILSKIRSHRALEMAKHEKIRLKSSLLIETEKCWEYPNDSRYSPRLFSLAEDEPIIMSISQKELDKFKEKETKNLEAKLLLDLPFNTTPKEKDYEKVLKDHEKSLLAQKKHFTTLSEVIDEWREERDKVDKQEFARRKSFIQFLKKNGLLVDSVKNGNVDQELTVEEFESVHDVSEIKKYLKKFKNSATGNKRVQLFERLVRYIRDYLKNPFEFRGFSDLPLHNIADLFNSLEKQVFESISMSRTLSAVRDLLLFKFIFMAPRQCKINQILDLRANSTLVSSASCIQIGENKLRISKSYQELLLEYLGKRKSGYLFSVDHKGIKPINQNALNRKLKSFCRQSGLKEMTVSRFQGSFYNLFTNL